MKRAYKCKQNKKCLELCLQSTELVVLLLLEEAEMFTLFYLLRIDSQIVHSTFNTKKLQRKS